ncbi:MAG TPA: hypothetical protein H9884_02905 [Candidatus Yaniella excrementigallinarum]|nr:hypothetical protein [Candidatus Yaniella excrementigallinarum]
MSHQTTTLLATQHIGFQPDRIADGIGPRLVPEQAPPLGHTGFRLGLTTG